MGEKAKSLSNLTQTRFKQCSLCFQQKFSSTKIYFEGIKKKHLPRMLVNGAPIIKNESECKEFIEHSNPDMEKLAIAGETLEVVTIIEKGKSCSVVLEMSPKIKGEILKNPQFRISSPTMRRLH